METEKESNAPLSLEKIWGYKPVMMVDEDTLLRFEDVFESAVEFDMKTHKRAKISPFCNLSNFGLHALSVKHTERLIKAVQENMLFLEGERHGYFFELIGFDDYAVLYCKYEQILGSRCMCKIDTNSIPEFIKNKPEES